MALGSYCGLSALFIYLLAHVLGKNTLIIYPMWLFTYPFTATARDVSGCDIDGDAYFDCAFWIATGAAGFFALVFLAVIIRLKK